MKFAFDALTDAIKSLRSDIKDNRPSSSQFFSEANNSHVDLNVKLLKDII